MLRAAALARVRLLSHNERVALLAAYVGDREIAGIDPDVPSSGPTTASNW